MYFIEDVKSAVKEVQSFLLAIFENSDDMSTRVSVDGIYGEESRKAVIEYQNLHGLKKSGIVDIVTFNSIYDTYKKIIEDITFDDHILTKRIFPFSLGDYGEDILIINLYLNELKKYYNISSVKKSMYYSKETVEAVKDVQRIFRTSENGIVTAALFNRMKEELSALQTKNF